MGLVATIGGSEYLVGGSESDSVGAINNVWCEYSQVDSEAKCGITRCRKAILGAHRHDRFDAFAFLLEDVFHKGGTSQLQSRDEGVEARTPAFSCWQVAPVARFEHVGLGVSIPSHSRAGQTSFGGTPGMRGPTVSRARSLGAVGSLCLGWAVEFASVDDEPLRPSSDARSTVRTPLDSRRPWPT